MLVVIDKHRSIKKFDTLYFEIGRQLKSFGNDEAIRWSKVPQKKIIT